jgi:hypothetical protein
MKIKNWDRFQHYKHRSPPWIRLYRSLLDDPEFQSLSEGAQALLPQLWLVASEHRGELPASSVLAWRLRKPEKRILQLLQELKGWCEQDASTLLALCKQDANAEESRVEESRVEKRETRLRASRFPEDWQPRNLAFGESATFDHFKSHHLAKGSRFVDWEQAWRTWKYKDRQFNNGVRNGQRGYAPRSGMEQRERVRLQDERQRMIDNGQNPYSKGNSAARMAAGAVREPLGAAERAAISGNSEEGGNG